MARCGRAKVSFRRVANLEVPAIWPGVSARRRRGAAGGVTLSVSRIWATVWATTTGAVGIEKSDANGSAGIDHLHLEQMVTLVGVPSAGRPPQNPRVDASWEVIAADALCCSGSADFPVVFPWELRFPRFLP